MIAITTALLIAALVVFIIAAIGVPSGRVNLIAAGLALCVVALLLGRV